MTHSFPIDPELRLLLQDIADDPKSRLFTPIPRPTRLTLSRPDPIGPAAVGLTSAERQLVRVYREETARLLDHAADWQLRQHALGEAQLGAFKDPKHQRLATDRSEILALFETRIERRYASLRDSVLAHHVALAGSMLSAPGGSPIQLAGLSIRLRVHDAAWIQMARALLLEGNVRTAIRVLAPLVREPENPTMRACALSWIGVGYGLLKDSGSAAQAHAAAATEDARPGYLFSWMCEALMAGDPRAALRAAARIDESVPPGSPSLIDWNAKLETRRALEPSTSTTRQLTDAAKGILRELGPAARSVIHGSE